MKVGALCAGYGGLELGLSQLTETELVWFSEINQTADLVMRTRFDSCKNYGDVKNITLPGEVDIVTAGFPCQPFSVAGKMKGMKDEEKWLIDDICRIASEANAKWLILENVKGIITANNGHAIARTVEAMALSGFTRWEWGTIPASAVGAPHKRERWFCVATNTDKIAGEKFNFGDGERCRKESWQYRGAKNEPSRFSFSRSSFEKYQPAIDRWEKIIGRRAPEPYQDYRLNKRFVEWMMGLPEDWVCGDDLAIPKTYAFQVMGNGVVPQQAAYAIKTLIGRLQNGE